MVETYFFLYKYYIVGQQCSRGNDRNFIAQLDEK